MFELMLVNDYGAGNDPTPVANGRLSLPRTATAWTIAGAAMSAFIDPTGRRARAAKIQNPPIRLDFSTSGLEIERLQRTAAWSALLPPEHRAAEVPV